MQYIMGRHPQQGNDEAFLGNWDLDYLDEVAFETKRLGGEAYDLEGRLIRHDAGIRPLFVKHAEIEAHARGPALKHRLQAEGAR